tara:strand:- start:167 stop:343 length:177 start_codon:yes stop_codon:yes gene_type:complete
VDRLFAEHHELAEERFMNGSPSVHGAEDSTAYLRRAMMTNSQIISLSHVSIYCAASAV